MGNFLDSWAEREQRRIERRQAKPQKPVPFPAFFRTVEAFFGTLALTLGGIAIPVFLIWIVALVAEHTMRSILLAVGLSFLLSLSVFRTGTLLHERRENGQSWLTGRTRESN